MDNGYNEQDGRGFDCAIFYRYKALWAKYGSIAQGEEGREHSDLYE